MPESIENIIRRSIAKSIVELVANVKDEIVTDAVKKFEREVRSAVATASVNLVDSFSIERMGAELLIHVKIEEGSK